MPENRGAVLAGFLALSAIALVPILICAWPPILDYPNHLARMHILASAPLSGDLARYYRISWSPIPDLAADAIVPLAARLMPVGTAMRMFLGIILVGLAGGAVVLHRAAFGRWSAWPLTAFLLLYNRMLLWGFVNYLAGLALTLWAVAGWIALERRPPAVRVAAGTIMATVLYLAHLAAFGCYALAIVALEMAPANPSRIAPAAGGHEKAHGRIGRLLLAGGTLIPALALFRLSPTSGAPGAIAYGNPFRKFDLPVSVFDDYSRPLDGATFAVLLLMVAFGLYCGAIQLHPRLRWSVGAIFAAFVVLPSRFLGASGIDHRLPIAIALLFVAASEPTLRRTPLRMAVGIGLLGLFVTRTAVVAGFWLEADHEYAALLPVFAQMASGAALAVATPPAANAGGVPLLHFPTIAVIERDAFVPSLFADRFQQPVFFTEEAKRLAAQAPAAALWQVLNEGAQPNLTGYDDLMIVDAPSTLDRSRLPGVVTFAAPRLLLVRLTPPSADRTE